MQFSISAKTLRTAHGRCPRDFCIGLFCCIPVKPWMNRHITGFPLKQVIRCPRPVSFKQEGFLAQSYFPECHRQSTHGRMQSFSTGTLKNSASFPSIPAPAAWDFSTWIILSPCRRAGNETRRPPVWIAWLRV